MDESVDHGRGDYVAGEDIAPAAHRLLLMRSGCAFAAGATSWRLGWLVWGSTGLADHVDDEEG
jgi:hypothetical protein